MANPKAARSNVRAYTAVSDSDDAARASGSTTVSMSRAWRVTLRICFSVSCRKARERARESEREGGGGGAEGGGEEQ